MIKQVGVYVEKVKQLCTSKVSYEWKGRKKELKYQLIQKVEKKERNTNTYKEENLE